MNRIQWVGLWLFLFIFSSFALAKMPAAFGMDVFVSKTAEDGRRYPLNGVYHITLELIQNDSEQFTKSFTTFITEGILTIEINDEDGLDTSLFRVAPPVLRLSISAHQTQHSSITNTGISSFSEGTEIFELPLYYLTHAKRSESTNRAKTFNSLRNLNLIQLDPTHLTVAIGTTNAESKMINDDESVKLRMLIDGTVLANAFIGDGSQLLNLDVIRWKRILNPERIHYTKGFVGIGIESPTENLHVSGNMRLSKDENIVFTDPAGDADDPLLTIRDTLQTTFKGEAPLISSLNASNIAIGTLTEGRLDLDYHHITGLGEISSAKWNSTSQIQDPYIANNLTINETSTFTNGSLSGRIELNGNFHVGSNAYDMAIKSSHWALNNASQFNAIHVGDIHMEDQHIRYADTLHINNKKQPVLSIHNNGALSQKNSEITSMFNPENSIQIGNSTNDALGTLRLSNYFEGYTSSGWTRLDQSGTFTGYSLFPKDNFSAPVIEIVKQDNTANIGVNESRPRDHLTVSGNVIFMGNTMAEELSQLSGGSYWLWAANTGSLRIGQSNLPEVNDSMFNPDRMGNYSVAIGKNAIAQGDGSINVSFSTDELGPTSVKGRYGIALGAQGLEFSNAHGIVVASQRLTTIHPNALSSIIFSSDEITDTPDFTGESSIVLNGNNPTTQFNNTIMGGQNLAAPLGNNSFFWGSNRRSQGIQSESSEPIDGTFQLSMFVKMGINTTFNQNEPSDLVVGDKIIASNFVGNGSRLTGDLQTNHLTVKIGEEIKRIETASKKEPQSIYVSNNSKALPKDTVSNQSIKDGSLVALDFREGSIGKNAFQAGSIQGDRLEQNALTGDSLKGQSLQSRLFSGITGTNFEDDAITSVALAQPSVYTNQITDSAVSGNHILKNQVNAPINNIARHAITADDIFVEELTSSPFDYFNNGAATGETIAHGALSTTLFDDGAIESSYFVYETATTPPQPNPQIQEHHLNAAAVRSNHIQDDALESRHFSDKSIHTNDLTRNAVESFPFSEDDPKIIATNQTIAEGPLFSSRHFSDNALTTDKFHDNCSSCESQTERFQLQGDQIADNAIAFDDDDLNGTEGDELADKSIELRHITPNAIIGRHLKTDAIKTRHFFNDTIVSRNLDEQSISSSNIVDGTLTISSNDSLGDFALKSFYGSHLVPKLINATHVSDNAVLSKNIANNSITSNHIVDFSLEMDDFQPGAFTTEKFKTSTVTSENLAESIFEEKHFGVLDIPYTKILDHSVSWDNFIPPPDGEFPVDRFSDNSLAFYTPDGVGQAFENDILLDASEMITKNSIPYDAFTFNTDDSGYPLSKLMTPLSVDHGGTGISSFLKDAIVFSNDHPTNSKLSQDPLFKYNDGIFFIGQPRIPRGFKGLLTTGNVLISNGALILKKYSDNEFTFATYNTADNAIQFTHRNPLDSNEFNMMLKTNRLYSKDALVLGDAGQANMIDLPSGFTFGATYRNSAPPENGMIVEGSIQIGGERDQDFSLLPEGVILKADNGIIHATSSNIGILVTESTPPHPSPILSEGRSIKAKGDTGINIISSDSNSIPIKVELDADGIDEVVIGISSSLELPILPPLNASAIQVTLNAQQTHVHTGSIGKVNIEAPVFYAGIYGSSSGETSTDYAGVFDSLATQKQPTFMGSLTNKIMQQSSHLHITSFKAEGPIVYQPQTNIISSIDWRKGNIAVVDVDNNDRTITFQTPPDGSAKLLIHVTHSGVGKLSFQTAGIETIRWKDDYEPELTATEGSVDFVSLFYDHQTNTYYGSAAYNFIDQN